MRGWGGRKFFLPLTMKEPVGKYSPLGAVLDTYKAGTSATEMQIVTTSV